MDNLTSQGPIQATAMASSMNDTSGIIPDALIDPALFQGTIIGADPSSSALQDMQDHYSQPFYDVAEDELRATLAQHRTRQVPQGGSSGHPSDNHVTAFRPSANTMTTLPVPNAPCASNLEDIPAEAELFGIDQFDAINGGPVYSFKQWLEIHGQHCYEQRVAEREMSWDDYCMSWAIMDSENPSRWSNPVSPENHQPELVPDFEDSFFADAARINGMSNEELLDSIRHPEVDMHSPYLPVEDTIPLQYLDNQRLSHDLGTSSLEHEFWP